MDTDYEAELTTLYGKAKDAREKQRRYFCNRTGENLDEAKAAEKELDKALNRLEGLVGEQKTIF